MGSNHAVEGNVIQHLSASQIGTFISCPTLWWIEKKARVPPPDDIDTTATDTGTSMHGEHEDYFNHGTPLKHGSLVRLVAHPKWPKRSKHILVEHPRDYKINIHAAGVPLKGRIDLLDGSDLISPLICDLKSMGSYRYALNAEALSRDTQLSIYGKYVFSIFPQAQSVRYAHGQALSKGEDARVVVSDHLSRAHVDQVFETIESVAARMVEVAKIDDIHEVPRDETGVRCEKFRGCPYKYMCPKWMNHDDPWADFDETPTPKPGEVTMSLREKLAKNTPVVGAGSAINPPDAPPPALVEKYIVPQAPIEAPAASPTKEGLYLYVNCYVAKNIEGFASRSLEDIIADHAAPLKVKHKVIDLRQVRYAEGVNELVASILRSPPTGIVYCTTNGLSATVVDALIPLATEVIRGH